MERSDGREDLLYISAIRRQKGGAYGIYICGECAAVIDGQTLAGEEALCAGAYISEQELEEIQARSDRNMARKKALGIISRREISSALLEQKLTESGFGPGAAEYAVEEMVRLGFVNDERCARMMAEDIYQLKHYGKRRCAYELVSKGIDRELAESTAAELEPDAREAIYALLTGKLARDMDSEAGIRRSTNTLMRYGFEPSDIRAALVRLRDEAEEE